MRFKLEGQPYDKQRQFFQSKSRYTAYGGARGGGKSWALRRKIILLCLNYPGINCLIVRRSFPELRYNHILPLESILCREKCKVAKYNETNKEFRFINGSRVILGYCDSEADVLRYQGQQYDIIALDEATQLTEYQFNTLKACLRGTNNFPKRMYLTCNPGGVGHGWVKRLFISRQFKEGERPEDYAFIQARVTDNLVLLEKDPDYLRTLQSLPDALREAWLNGSWDSFEGKFFSELCDKHFVRPEQMPVDDYMNRFIAFDYGFDMLAVLWIAVDVKGKAIVYREYQCPRLTLSEAAERIISITGNERIEYAVASPDLWNKQNDTGYSGAEVMLRDERFPPLMKADNRRIPGWWSVREYLQIREDGEPRLHIYSTCNDLIRCMNDLVYDKKRVQDAASEPHEITHLPEALRYGVMSRLLKPLSEEEKKAARYAAYEDRYSLYNY